MRPKGSWVAVGRGSGSHLAQRLNCLLLPTEGSVSVDTYRSATASLRKVRQKVGLVFQYPEQQLFEETVFKEVSFGPRNWGFQADHLEKSVEEALELVGIGRDLYEASPFRLSGGQKRRVAIASTLSPPTPIISSWTSPPPGSTPRGGGSCSAFFRT